MPNASCDVQRLAGRCQALEHGVHGGSGAVVSSMSFTVVCCTGVGIRAHIWDDRLAEKYIWGTGPLGSG